jgi:hypothetical protein
MTVSGKGKDAGILNFLKKYIRVMQFAGVSEA